MTEGSNCKTEIRKIWPGLVLSCSLEPLLPVSPSTHKNQVGWAIGKTGLRHVVANVCKCFHAPGRSHSEGVRVLLLILPS